MKHVCLFVATALAMLGCTESSTLRTGQRSSHNFDRAVDSVYPALVRVNVVSTSPASGRLVKSQGSGSGAVISKEGYVVTNHHVAGNAERIVCRMSDGQEIDAIRVGTDPMTDICILQLKLSQRKSDKPLAVATWGDSDKLRVGDTVLAMGSPAGVSQSVTVGVVSNTAMISPYGAGLQMQGESVGTLVRWIGHDAVIYPGNSGGPLVNLAGEIIGVNEVGIGSLGGAIPSNLARTIVAQIIADRKVKRAFTGLECQPRLKTMRDGTGVLVGGVTPGSPAEKAGLQPGDLVTAIDGVAVTATTKEDLPIVHQLMLSKPVGKALKITFLRGNQTKSVDVVTVPREPARGDDEEIKAWGMTALDMTGVLATELQRPSKDGVIVQSVLPSGPCSNAKPALAPVDIITEVAGKKVADLASLRRITDELTKPNEETPVLVAFDRGRQHMLTVVKLGKKPQAPDALTARKAYLGIETQVLTKELAKGLGMKETATGVRITNVKPGTEAEKAGLLVGDIILKVGKFAVKDTKVEDNNFFYMIQACPIDSTETLTLFRNGQTITNAIKLECSPVPLSELRVYEDRQFEFSVRDLADIDRQDKKLAKETKGVLVTAVENGGWADLGGLAVGDVVLAIDGKKLDGLDTLEKHLAEAQKAKTPQLVLFVKRGVHTMFLQIEPMWEK